ncbi:hypothetical protein SAMN05421833_129106 [Microbispora rosea]|uniref:Uncharacterized protein n=1 Tax=Microbispora rosea TaxID=58117 RepID=A0A1N7GJQ3_9ACTN|nr:hypothetical protein [Microbispora rosea]GIH51698.1 hypothetical protein Mro03_68770 [Microbispora rosea subsp. rosea]SIS12718.1 hypothetical protein SAMN05421833_129106 [Microbispora rosea]
MISVTDAYRVLDERRDADHDSSTTAAVDAFTAIALGMSAGEHQGPPELYATFAIAQQEALEGMAALGAQLGSADTSAAVPDLDAAGRLGSLLCEVLVQRAETSSDPSRRIAVLNAAAHAGRIRDLLA